MSLTLNMIFCEGTVRILRLAAFSFLRNSDYSLRLIGNALGGEENRMLREFAQRSDRLAFVDFPTKRILPHDTMLTLLFARSNAERFAIVDSDVFALLPIAAQIDEDCERFDAVSYADPVSVEFRDEVKRRAGLNSPQRLRKRLERFRTYFAVFRAEMVREVEARSGVSFHAYVRRSQVPKEAWSFVDSETVFARGKLDSAELLAYTAAGLGHRVSHRACRGLLHLGNMTRPNQSEPRGVDSIRDADLFGESAGVAKGAEDAANFKARMQHTRSTFRRYFGCLLDRALAGKRGPKIEVAQPAARERLLSIEASLQSLAAEFRGFAAAES